MARWILNRPAAHCSEAEIKAANHLKKLSDRWTVRWGFYYADNKGVRREGDFLILGPDAGLLVLEVKGRPMRHFAGSGVWEGDHASNGDHPLFQLDQEWKAVINELDSQGGPRPHVSKALGLPNEFVHPEQTNAEGIPREKLSTCYDVK